MRQISPLSSFCRWGNWGVGEVEQLTQEEVKVVSTPAVWTIAFALHEWFSNVNAHQTPRLLKPWLLGPSLSFWFSSSRMEHRICMLNIFLSMLCCWPEDHTLKTTVSNREVKVTYHVPNQALDKNSSTGRGCSHFRASMWESTRLRTCSHSWT